VTETKSTGASGVTGSVKPEHPHEQTDAKPAIHVVKAPKLNRNKNDKWAMLPEEVRNAELILCVLRRSMVGFFFGSAYHSRHHMSFPIRFKVIGELFSLEKTAWWRRNVIGVTRSLLRFTIHGTLFRSVQKGLAYILAPEQLQWMVEWVRDVLWPDGQLFTPGPERSQDEKDVNQAEVGKHGV